MMGTPVRYTHFWPTLVFFLGFGAFTFYQITILESQYDQVTRAVDRMDPKVKKSQASKERFYTMTHAILAIAPHDPIAEQIATQFNLRKLIPDDASTLDNVLSPSSAGVAAQPPVPALPNAPDTNSTQPAQ